MFAAKEAPQLVPDRRGWTSEVDCREGNRVILHHDMFPKRLVNRGM